MDNPGLMIFAAFGIVFVITLIIALITRKPPEKEPEIITKLKELYNSGEAIDYRELLKMIEIPEDRYTDWCEYLNLIPDSKWHDLAGSYSLALSFRHNLKTNPIHQIEDDSIVLKDNEAIYFRAQFDLHEMKVQSRNVIYGGIRMSKGMAKAGSLSYVTNEKKDFSISDIGKLFITNKRIIFVGEHNFKNLSISLNNILSYHLYKDAVIIMSTNRKPVLFVSDDVPYNFDKYEKDINPIFSDDVTKYMIVLSRILDGNQDLEIKIDN